MPIRLVTWNMQGGSGTDTVKNRILNDFMSSGYDVICLQEATNHLNSFSLHTNGHHGIDIYHQLPPEAGRLPASNQYTCYFYRWGISNNRCSLTTYVKNGNTGLYDFGRYSYGDNLRSMLWVRVNLGGTLLRIGNVHLPSGNHLLARHTLINFIHHMSFMASPFVIAGDFNMPQDYIQANFTDPDNFHHPNVPTQQSGSILDYVYSAEPVSVDGYSNAFHSDHRYLMCTIS